MYYWRNNTLSIQKKQKTHNKYHVIKLSYRLKQSILVFGDIACFYAAFFVSLIIRHGAIPTTNKIDEHLPLFTTVFCLWLVFNYINGLYDLGLLSYDKRYYRRFIETGVISLIVSVFFFYIFPTKELTPKTILLLNIFLGYGFSSMFRIAYDKSIGVKKLLTNVIIVGISKETDELIQLLHAHPEKGYSVVAIIDPEKQIKPTTYKHTEVFYGLQTIRPCITNYKGQIIVIAPHLEQQEDALRELYQLLFWGVHVVNLPSFYETITGRIPPSTFSESWFLNHLQKNGNPIYEKVRTVIDYIAVIAIGSLFVLTFPIIALCIKFTSPGPIFIRQERIGQQGRLFTMYKFRSMYALAPDGSAETDGWQFAKKQDTRITSIGKILRKTRIDELPQVINLCKRDITLIGPRPERPAIVRELEERMPYYPLRHLVRPGLTGWAVIHQQYTDTIESSLEKLQYDLYYIKNRSFLLDVTILLRTVNVVVRFMGQ